MAGRAMATNVLYPIASRIGGRMDTGVAPTATISVPKPMLTIMICTARWSPAMVLMNTMIRLRAPVFSMKAICSSEVATISDTDNDRTNPAAVERRMTSSDVLEEEKCDARQDHPAHNPADVGRLSEEDEQAEDDDDRQQRQQQWQRIHNDGSFRWFPDSRR